MDRTPSLEITKRTPDEVVHYYDSETKDLISSKGNTFLAKLGNREYRFDVPLASKFAIPSYFRLARRALRLDKSNAVFNYARDGIVILYRGQIFFYDLTSKTLKSVGRLRQCRNVLHRGIAVGDRSILFGEYGANPDRHAVPVWRSTDDGRSWEIIFEFPAGSIKHIHGVYSDPYSDSVWIPTGDFSGECYVFECRDHEFRDIVKHGDGEQRWRPVSMFFDLNRIVWAMDSQLQPSCLQVFDRATADLSELRSFEGPVWYSKRFSDGSAVLQTTVEVGDGVKSDFAHVHFSKDLINWQEVARYRKDHWPMRYFKFGVIAFADGPQTRDDFVMFGEALRGLDGQACYARINE